MVFSPVRKEEYIRIPGPFSQGRGEEGFSKERGGKEGNYTRVQGHGEQDGQDSCCDRFERIWRDNIRSPENKGRHRAGVRLSEEHNSCRSHLHEVRKTASGVDVRELNSTDAPLQHLQPVMEERDAEALFSDGRDRESGKDKQAQDRRGVEVLGDSKEVHEDYGISRTTYCTELKELRFNTLSTLSFYRLFDFNFYNIYNIYNIFFTIFY